MREAMNTKKQRSGISPAAAVVTGAVIGAGAAVAGVAALRNEKNRAIKPIVHVVKFALFFSRSRRSISSYSYYFD